MEMLDVAWDYETPGGALPVIWKNDNDENAWVVEYSYLSFDNIANKSLTPKSRFYCADGLKDAIIFARNAIATLHSISEEYGVQMQHFDKVWLLQPDDAVYVDVTDDADAIHAIFRYDE